MIIDFETFGQNTTTCSVINCAFFVFDWDRFDTNPYTWEELVGSIQLLKLDVAEQVSKYGYKISKRDIAWWDNLPPNVKKQAAKSKNDLTLEQFCNIMLTEIQYLKIKHWWSRSNTFDPLLLSRCFTDTGKLDQLQKVLKYWTVRDLRTYFDAKFNFNLEDNAFCPIEDKELWEIQFEKHNSVHDLAADILRLQKVERIVRGCDD